MISMAGLWLPVLVAAIAVFIASSLIHMVFKWHNSDYRRLDNEADVLAALRTRLPAPGQYTFPHCTDMKAMQEADMQAKYNTGPVGLLTILPNGAPRIGRSLGQWFALNLVIAALAAGVARHVLGDSNAHNAAHLAAILTFLTYAGGSIQSGIWMGKGWGSVLKDQLDALIYAIASGLVFLWLWP